MSCSKFHISIVNYQRRIPAFILAFAVAIIVFAFTTDCQALTLTITANNGSVTATPDKADYAVGEIVELKPKPDTGYYFSGWAGDAQGRRLVLNLTMDSDKSITANFDVWQAPIGVPAPEFGVFEIHAMYEGQTYDFGSGSEPYRDAGNGPYTHYVDNTHPDATDSDNPYGTQNLPRVTIPVDLPAGSVVEVHGGPYDYMYSGEHKVIPLIGSGTQSRPVFIRGINNPKLDRGASVEGQYLIIEGFEAVGFGIRPRGRIRNMKNSYLSIRNSDLHRQHGARGTGVGLGWPHGNCDNHPEYCDTTLLENVVVYNNTIHDYGYLDWMGDYTGDSSRDSIGVYVHHNAHQTWVVDNHIYNVDGDGVHLNAWNINDATQFPPNYTYIGRNEIHYCRENAYDSKVAYNSIVSQNTFYDIHDAPGSDGSAAVIQTEHETEKYPKQKTTWHLFNEIYNITGNGYRVNGPVEEVYIIGNFIHDISSPDTDSVYYAGSGLQTFYHAKPVYFVNNVVANAHNGFYDHNWRPNQDSEFYVHNNIFSDITNRHLRFSGYDNVIGPVEANHNLYYNHDTQINIEWDGPVYNSVSEFQFGTGQGTNSIEADPQFINPSNNNFDIQSSSPAMDAGIESSVYDTFYNLYGIDIRKDMEGTARPQGGGWDIGAYEFVPGPSLLVSSTAGGSVTAPGEDYFQYDDTTDVAVEAAADQYYYFVNWTGTAVDNGKVADPTLASTTVTVDSGYTLVANFDTDYHTLTVSSTSGGSVTAPGEGAYLYDDQVAVSIQAAPAANYHFMSWTGTAVDAGKVAAPDSASTTVTIDSDYTLVANFAIDQHNLTTSSNSGGSVTTPGEGTYAYDQGASASVVAAASANYHFVNWTGTAVDAGKVANAGSASTTVTMDAAYSIQANFALDQNTLTVSSTTGGSVSSPGEGSFTYDYNSNVSVQATPANDYYFVNWTGTAVNAGKVANPNSASTTVTVDAGYTLAANFGRQDGVAPTISGLSPAAGSIQAPLDSLVILHVTDAGIGVAASTVQIRLHDVVIHNGDVSSYDSARGTCRRTGNINDYTYAFQADQPFDYDELQTVAVNAADLGGVVMDQQTYSFRTEMRSFGANKQVSSGLESFDNDTAATACDSSGNIWVAWDVGPVGNRDIFVGKLAAGQDSFSAGVRLTTDLTDQANPAIAVGSDGTLHVVWQSWGLPEEDNRRGNWDIYGSTSADGTNWTTQRRIADADEQETFNQTNPVVAVGSQSPNRAYVAWQDERAGGYDIYIAESSDAFATNTISQVTSDPAAQTQPAIAVNSSNAVYLLWTDARNTANGTDIYGAAGSPWTNVPVVAKAANQSSPVIAVESSGSVLHILWVDQASNNGDIYYGSSSGLPASPLAGSNFVDDTSGAAQVSPSVAVTGTGATLNVFACWQDERNVAGGTGDTDIYMVQVDSGSGTNVFVGDGSTNSNQTEPAICIDQSGYPYIVWTDDRGTNSAIYYAASTCAESTALASGLIDASSGGTIGTADEQSITSVDDVSVALPAGACPYDATISVSRVENPHDSTLSFLNGFEFSPSGMEFNSPVTITLPYEVASESVTPTPYWYNSVTGAMSRQGINNIEIIEISSNLHALRFTTTHLTPYYALGGTTATSSTTSSSSGGGGGGCMLSDPSREGNMLEYFLPYAVLGLFMFVLKLKDRRGMRSVK